MSTAKISGYGIKVTADDAQMDVKAIAALFAENDKSEYLDAFFEEYPEITDFSFLAFSFMEMLEHNERLEFVFVDDRDTNSFVIVSSSTAAKITDESLAIKPGTLAYMEDSLIIHEFIDSFLPGYEADWICEEISPEWADIVDFTDSDIP